MGRSRRRHGLSTARSEGHNIRSQATGFEGKVDEPIYRRRAANAPTPAMKAPALLALAAPENMAGLTPVEDGLIGELEKKLESCSTCKSCNHTYPVPVGQATPDVGQVVVHGAVTVTVTVLTVSQVVVLGLTGAAGVEDDQTGELVLLHLTGAAGEELLGGAELDQTGEGQVVGEAVTGQTVVETATTEVTTLVSVLLSSGQLVTVGWQE